MQDSIPDNGLPINQFTEIKRREALSTAGVAYSRRNGQSAYLIGRFRRVFTRRNLNSLQGKKALKASSLLKVDSLGSLATLVGLGLERNAHSFVQAVNA